MEHTEDNRKNEAIVRRYKELIQIKGPKLTLMKAVRDYINPPDSSVSSRTFRTEVEGFTGGGKETIFDISTGARLERYTRRSLKDIINPFEPFFTLSLKKKAEIDETEIREWMKNNEEAFFTFINESDYYDMLINDKKNYDIHGFSGLTFYIDAQTNEMVIEEECPFDIVLSNDKREYYWLLSYSPSEMMRKFNHEVPKEDMTPLVYQVLCSNTPNNEKYLGEGNVEAGSFDDKGKLKKSHQFVQTFTLVKKMNTVMYKNEKDTATQKEGFDFIKEIGKRTYFNEPFTVVVRDMAGKKSFYGQGWGKRLLIQTQNLNQLRANILKVSDYHANPSGNAPLDVVDSFNVITPGRLYPMGYMGDKVEPLPIQGDLRGLYQVLEFEDAQVRQAIPENTPALKGSRQSQFEIGEAYKEAKSDDLSYKLTYLQKGVAKHLSLMFKLAIKLGVIEKPPGELTWKDVEPSIASLLLKEYKNQKSRTYIEVFQLTQGLFSFEPEGLDNFKVDDVIRNIAVFSGVPEMLEDQQVIEKIRAERQQQQQQQQQLAQMEAQANIEATRASATMGATAGMKNLAEARKLEAEETGG